MIIGCKRFSFTLSKTPSNLVSEQEVHSDEDGQQQGHANDYDPDSLAAFGLSLADLVGAFGGLDAALFALLALGSAGALEAVGGASEALAALQIELFVAGRAAVCVC